MGDPQGFLKLQRVGFQKRDPRERVRDYRQYFSLPGEPFSAASSASASRFETPGRPRSSRASATTVAST